MKVTSRQLALSSILLCLPVSLLEARPPQEAFDACRHHSSGSSCTVSTPRGQLNGQCRQPPRESQLVCVPDGHRPEQARGRGGHTRNHTTTQSDGNPDLQTANQSPITANEIAITVQEPWRILSANGIAKHNTGRFPNRGNPNAIREQQYQYRVPLAPEQASRITELKGHSFGLAVNGVPFDPGAAEWYRGQRGQWQYEALSGAVPLGIDNNHAHVQPNGAYHYHGLPTGLMAKLNVTPNQHSALIGWAADGFPIYALYGFSDGSDTSSGISQHTSSYRLKSGKRPTGGNNPGGHYDGTFIADYEYMEGQGSLDECNGRFTKTPEFPQGTYAYFLTEDWPVIPRCYKGTPSKDFTEERKR